MNSMLQNASRASAIQKIFLVVILPDPISQGKERRKGRGWAGEFEEESGEARRGMGQVERQGGMGRNLGRGHGRYRRCEPPHIFTLSTAPCDNNGLAAVCTKNESLSTLLVS
jgi:hypothetical protein